MVENHEGVSCGGPHSGVMNRKHNGVSGVVQQQGCGGKLHGGMDADCIDLMLSRQIAWWWSWHRYQTHISLHKPKGENKSEGDL